MQIDSHPNRGVAGKWRTEFDRAIYFIELRDGYACSWCEVRGSQITLIPHPLSGCMIRQFAYPTEAEIIGQVTGVAMRLVPSPDEQLRRVSKIANVTLKFEKRNSASSGS